MKEKTIIKTLRTMSKNSKADTNFKSELLFELKSRLGQNKFNFLSFFSMKKLAILGLFLVIVVGASIPFLNRLNKPKEIEKTVSTSVTEQLTTTNNNNAASGMMLAVDTWNNIEDAQKATSFTILYPKVLLNTEGIALIETSQDVEGSDSNLDSYYITYAKNRKEFYKVSGAAWEREDLQGEEVSVKGTKAYYYAVPLEELPEEGNIASDGGGPVTKSLLFWNDKGKSYEISEFGELSKGDLLRLAESM